MGGGDFRTDSQGTEFVQYVPLGEWELKDVPYHTSWNWIIPVLRRIKRECEGIPAQLLDYNLYSEIDEVYEAVVWFIQEYNLTPKEVV